MLPLIAAAGISAGLGLLQTGLGIGKAAKANKTRRKAQSFFEANQYKVPDSATAALGVAQKQASSLSLPGESQIRAKIGETTATGINQARNVGTSSADILGMMSGLYVNQQRQEVGLGIQGANRYDQNQRYLGQALNDMAGYEDKKWQYNVLYPYQQMMGQAGQLSGQANQMISSGIGQVAGAASSFMQGQAIQAPVTAAENSLGLGGNTQKQASGISLSGGGYNASSYVNPEMNNERYNWLNQ